MKGFLNKRELKASMQIVFDTWEHERRLAKMYAVIAKFEPLIRAEQEAAAKAKEAQAVITE